jgi:uncharacterized protein YfaS (alpha-2-macroglobulin family)
MRTSAVILAIIAVLLSAPAVAEPIERIRPSEGIASIRIDANVRETQIHVTFADDMIPLGGGYGEFPVKLEGPGTCNWGWRGPRTVSCLLGQDDRLPLAERYSLVIEDGLTTVSGTPVPSFRLDFETDKPTVSYSNIDWDGPTSPVIYLQTNVPVSARELQRRIRLEPLSQAASSVRVKASRDPDPMEYLSDELQFAIRPDSDLAPDTAYVVRVEEGLSGIDSGLVGSAHDAGSLRTHSEFEYLGIGCGPHADRSYWEHQQPVTIPSDPDCAPEQPVAILFSAEPEVRGLYGILTDAGLAPEIASTLEVRPVLFERPSMSHYQASKVIYGLRLSGFPAGKSHNVVLPAELVDRFGRQLEPVTAEFPTRNYVPAFLNHLTLDVVASGSGDEVEFATVNTDAIAARFYKDEPPGIVSLQLETESPGLNERGKAVLEAEEQLGKPWGILVGEVAITHRALVNKHQLRGFPIQYAQSVGAILSPWDVVVAAKGLGLKQRHSIWVSSLDTGDAIADATVELLERQGSGRERDSYLATAYRTGNVLGTARTNDDGFAEIFPSPNAPTNVYPSMVRVTKGDTIVVLPVEAYQFAHNGFEDTDYRRSMRFPNIGYVGEGAVVTWGVTDKPLYRSGETVQVKGYVRVRDDNRLSIPDQKEGWELSCAAYPNDLCTGRTVDLDAYGAFETTIELPESVLDGEYRVSVQSGFGGLPALSFRVASYKPKPHRVEAKIPADRIVGDEPIPVNAMTEYFAGGALKNTDAQVFIETQSDAPPVPEPLLAKYYFGRDRWYWRRTFQTVVDAKFDDKGQLTGTFLLPPDSPASGKATVTVGALHEGGDWAFSDPVKIEYVRKAYILGLSQESEFIVAGEPYQAGVMLVDLSGEEVNDLAVVQTLEYPNHRYSGKTQPSPDIGGECTVSITADTPASCDLVPTRVGRAVLRAKLMRGDEELLDAERQVSVIPTKSTPWYSRKSDRLEIELADEQLEAGQTAEIVVDVPYDQGSILFALHRNNVFHQWREVLPKGANTVRIPLAEEHAPGFTLTAIARPVGSGSGTSIGVARVEVRSAHTAPALSIETDSEKYKAGDEVRLTVKSSATGKSQLAVAVIDEAVLDLVPNVDDLFDPQGEGFAGLLKMWSSFRWWQLSRAMGFGGTADSGLEEITVTANRMSYDRGSGANLMAMSADAAPGGGGTGGPGLRHDFAEAAYFNPNIITSESGDAEIKFTVPDNLGQWRVVVVGADTQGQLFANTDKFDVALPLEVRADLPTRLIKGDTIQPIATALNRKEVESEVTLSLEIEAGDTSATDTRTTKLSTMESFSASATIGAVEAEEIQLTATATDSEDSDGLRISAPIVDPVELRSWTSIAPLSTSANFEQPIELPVNALQESAELRVVLDKSVVGDLSQTFHYMSQAKHRSWEQILSRAVVAAYASSWEEAGVNRASKEDIRNLLLQGSNFQTPSGGMSHFEPREDRANDYLSAYTLLALGWIGKQGFDVPAYQQRLAQFVYQRANLGLRDRRTSYRMTDMPSDRDMPVMLAALSSTPFGGARLKDQFSQYLRSHADEYDVDALAYALITATNIDASPELRANLSDRLQAQLVETFDRTEISGGDYRFGSRNELYCVVLSALQQAREFAPEARALTKLVRGGYEFRDENSGFGNTHANAVCVVALTQYKDEFEAPSEALSATVVAEDVELFSVALDADETTQTSDAVALPMTDRRSEVTVSLTEGTTGYASTNIRYEVDLSKEIERSHGYTIKRTYSVYRRNSWQPLKSGGPIEQGEWVRIDLEIMSPVVRRFVAISDPTPAGLEPVDQSLVSAIPGGATAPVRWWNAFNQRALSNEQSKFYAEWLSAGSHTVTYYAQAKFAGEFMALPAKVESMYSDGVFATTKPETLRVESSK